MNDHPSGRSSSRKTKVNSDESDDEYIPYDSDSEENESISSVSVMDPGTSEDEGGKKLSTENESEDDDTDSSKNDENNLENTTISSEKDSTKTKLYTKCRTCGVYTSSMDNHRRSFHEKPYKCNKCTLTFAKKTLVVKHKLESHSAERMLKCHYCWETFKNMKCLINHNKKKHKGLSSRFSCDECGKPCQDSLALSSHKLSHTKRKSNKCNICDKCYALESTLQVHMKNHFENKNELKCSVCSKHFTRKGKLRDHELTHSEDRCEKWIPCPHIEPTYVTQNNNFPVFCKACNGHAVCTFCGFAFETKQRYMAHTHNNFCIECGLKFFDARFYDKHVHYHSANILYKCELCKYGFETLVSLSLHNTKQHAKHLNKKKMKEKKVFECHICGKNFSTNQNVQFHIKIVHTDNGLEFSCEHCGKQFVRKTLLNIHKRKHDKLESEKFKCNVCGKGFSRKTDLNRHVSSHSDATPFSCDICGVCVKSNRNLKLHMNTHKEKSYECRVCQKRFSQMCYLKVHMKTHDNSKCYQCDTCGKSYLKRQALEQHNTAQFKFQCENCQQYFCSAYSLRNHVLKTKCFEKPNDQQLIGLTVD